MSQLDTVFYDLAANPEIGRLCDEIQESYFKFGVGKHLIFYRYKEKDHIEIVRILHTRMDTEQHL